MNTREIAAGYRLAHWAGILGERSASGQSIREYCKTAGIAENVYYYWQRKVREEACKGLASQIRQTGQELAPQGWTRLEAPERPRVENELTIEIGGCVVTATAETDPELLIKVCRLLKVL